MIPKVNEMDELLERALLFDFYGELLTDHQKEIYEAFIQEDLSLGEIASDEGISRQGVHDLIRRCDRILNGYEQKLHLVEKFLSVKDKVKQIDELSEACVSSEDAKQILKIRDLADQIMEEM